MTGIPPLVLAQIVPPAGVARPTPPVAISKPAARAMDTRPPEINAALTAKGDTFFNGATHTVDTVINMMSAFGSFKVESFPNPSNPTDIQYVVFFYNKITAETFEVHGTIAVAYINSVRNSTAITDFPISDSRVPISDKNDSISYLSQSALQWHKATNAVATRYYKPYAPGNATVSAKLHEYDPVAGDTLVAFSEAYTLASNTLAFTNWKDVPNLGVWDGSIKPRAVGMPSQVLLHETAGQGNLSPAGISHDGNTFFIPHFCVNNIAGDGKGAITQFVDIATQVWHGETLNSRSIGIEFVNTPIEAFKLGPDNKPLKPAQPMFNLEKSDKGIYITTKLATLPRLFIPLEFSAEQAGGYYELALETKTVLNFATLKAGVGPKKLKVVVEDGASFVLKFVKSDKFEHLATLVSALVSNGLVKGVSDLTVPAVWTPVVKVGDAAMYLAQHITVFDRATNVANIFMDTRLPGIYTHLQIAGSFHNRVFDSGHVDGTFQGMYLYLKLCRGVPVEAVLQIMVTCLTSVKTAAEKAGVKLTSVLSMDQDGTITVTKTPIENTFTEVIELDEALIAAVTAPPAP